MSIGKDEGDLARRLIEALPEPSLIVAEGRVLVSNAAARAVLGERIDGADVRLATVLAPRT
jgi:hypothetical protein